MKDERATSIRPRTIAVESARSSVDLVTLFTALFARVHGRAAIEPRGRVRVGHLRAREHLARLRLDPAHDVFVDVVRTQYEHVGGCPERRHYVDTPRLTREMLADESAMIVIVEPWGNVMCQETRGRYERVGMRITNEGDWPLEQYRRIVETTDEIIGLAG